MGRSVGAENVNQVVPIFISISELQHVYGDSATPQLAVISFLLQQDSFRVQCDILCVRISCIFSMYSQYKGCSQGTNISNSSSSDGR
jgi:hypothetical protein